jgi:hypothetical protein
MANNPSIQLSFILDLIEPYVVASQNIPILKGMVKSFKTVSGVIRDRVWKGE